MSNLNEDDIARYMENESIVKSYQFNDDKGQWQQMISYETVDGELVQEWCGCMAVDVPVNYLLIKYEDFIAELSYKEMELSKKKENFNQKEFEIVYMSDINFKELYGSTSEKVRKQHASKVLKSLKTKLNGLELSIDYLKRYLVFIRELCKWKRTVKESKQ